MRPGHNPLSPLIPKENPMQYKTIMLELLEQSPETLEQLRTQRQLLPTLERFALALKADHEAWIAQLSRQHPEMGAEQIASEAMELAIEATVNRLSCGLDANDDEASFLDGAISFIRRTSQPK
jgi:2-oxo-4-hydroxy-4-carboxy--5-ureidoimidazoline (OHCU) decarboxylase